MTCFKPASAKPTSSRAIRFALLLSCGLVGGQATNAMAEESGNPAPLPVAELDTVTVHGRAMEQIGRAYSASEGVVGYADFENRPLSRVGELIEVVPGMVATQHSGTGKANQYFLRGFNLDHGTDFAAWVDGAPVNMRTHGHGQGYLDLNFLIPELVERVTYSKGTYHAEAGDFAVAGMARMKTYDRLEDSFAQITVGEDGYRRALVAVSAGVGPGDLLVAGEATFFDSPFVLDEDLEKFNGMIKYTAPVGDRDLRISLSGYDGSWTATDQIPERAILSGDIDRLGYVDPALGGETTRIALAADLESEATLLGAYALYYDFQLFSNFTYFLNDPVNGDQFEQRDERTVIGGYVRHTTDLPVGGMDSALVLGADVRYDDISTVGLFNTRDRVRLSALRDDGVKELSLGAFARLDVALSDRWRAELGLRGDYYHADVDALLAVNSGSADDAVLSPSASLAFRATPELELYASVGQGFHSNDVRGATTVMDPATGTPVDPVPMLVKARGVELGARYQAGRAVFTLSGFYLKVDSELVYVGDAGTNEPNDASRRYGVEFSAFVQATDRLVLDLAAAYTDARFKGVVDDRIPNAVKTVIGGGVSWSATEDLTATLRVRHFGKAPLIEDGSASSRATTVANLGVYYDLGPLGLSVDVLNLFDSKDADITYFYDSRLAAEPAPVEDIHLHPVEPRQVRLTARYLF